MLPYLAARANYIFLCTLESLLREIRFLQIFYHHSIFNDGDDFLLEYTILINL